MKSNPFELLKTQPIDSLKVVVEHYRHRITGAEHYHLAADDPQNVFMVALRTVPMDSTGVAHILEHTTLCGSEKYPVRDPFFMMIRRSLNTFMNAFTSSDWTAYPFATENRKDFQNLLQVYMDAVFFPNLNKLDFIQEGHRLEFAEMENPESELVYKGVVYNEMKGAMSSPVSTLWQDFSAELYPTSTYHYNSGGDPVNIPELTHEQLVEFHRYHYHPSNSVFMTYGDISAAEHQTQFENLALARFKNKVPVVKVSLEERYAEPKIAQGVYALNEASLEAKTHIVMGWLLGENKDTMDVLKGHLLSSVLLENSASPLRKVLETTELANAPSPLCGLEDSNREMAFIVGVQGSEAAHTDAIKTLILQTLKAVVEEDVDAEMIESALHQLELSQREIGGDGYPYGLQLMLQSLAGAMHDGDPIALLDTDAALNKLRVEALKPGFIPKMIQTWLLDNPHQVCFTLAPDAQLSEQKEQAEKSALAQIKAQLSPEAAQAIIDQSLALQARQELEDDISILPEVTKADIPADIKQIHGVQDKVNDLPLTHYVAGTNGLIYEQIIIDVPDLTPQEQALLPLFNACLPEVGSAGRDYLATQARHSAVTGGISAKTNLRTDLLNPQIFKSHLVLSGKALNRHESDLAQVLLETLQTARFDELDRLDDLMGQVRSSVDQGVTGNGHGLAMMAASQHFTPVANWAFNRSGFAGIQFIKQLYKDINTEGEDGQQALQAFANTLSGIQRKMMNTPKQALLVADEAGQALALQTLPTAWQELNHAPQTQGLRLSASQMSVKQAWITSSQVNFCAKAYPVVGAGHEDAPILSVLSAVLRNGFLHSQVREKGGAYGGGASFNPESAAFNFYSYRDPRLMETYADFDRAIDWLMSSDAKQAQVEEAILNIISAMDKPGSPAGEAKKAFYQDLYGKTYELRMAYRLGVLNCTLEQCRTVAQKYLLPEQASWAVLTHEGTRAITEAAGFDLIKL
ncbi:insulinase family protein [Thiosulfativibrio zosterae]|uniref:Peptidase M16 n=1 Tax=Thiosulfativibrio zosterae TaxID=2675053 RepID=A0A6F8PNC8_9GAMM|nr:insulinase family protein [Thiosulfativibrio zosterae]BBP43596.1 peptidase M16 [Thiosulfativibrio zosterae]